MATLPTAQFWIRTDGADTNGGGYDSGISGAATNYSDQAAAQVIFTVLTLTVTTNVLTDTGGLGLFTTLMIGNAINVPGKGYYFITAFTNSNVVTVSLGTGAATSFVAQPGKVGGALRNLYALSNGGTVAAPGTTTPLVAGNRNNFRASGSGSVGSPDYTQSGYAIYPAGNTTNGLIYWVAYNGTPYVKGDGLMFYNFTGHKFVGGYWTGTNAGGNGAVLGIFGQLTNCTWVGCTVDGNNANSGIGGTSAGVANCNVIGCTLVGGGSSSGIGYATFTYGCAIKDSSVSGWGGSGGIFDTAGVQVSNCAIYSNTNIGVFFSSTASVVVGCVDGCTIDGNGSDGIKIASTSVAFWTRIINNNITNNTGAGINVAAGTATANTAAIAYEDYNNVWHNTGGNYNGINAGAHDISVDPSYV